MNKNKPANKNMAKIRKTKPTIFPFGFGIAHVEESFIVVDFLDENDGESIVIESIAMPKERALELAKALQDILSDEK